MTITKKINRLNRVALTCAMICAPLGASAASQDAKHKARVPPKASPKHATHATHAAQTKAAPTNSASATVAHARAAASENTGWLRDSSAWTRWVRAADQPNGTAFGEALALAIDSQYVVVPYSFVSDVGLSRSNAHFYIEDTHVSRPMEAQLVDLDLAGNLALLHTEQPLIPSFSRGNLRLDTPSAEEPLLVLASRDWVRGGARFLRSKIDGYAIRYQIALGAGDFASARYVFDRGGRLVAVAAGGEGGESAWSGSARSIFELLRRQDGPHPASVGGAAYRRSQLFYWQQRWTQALAPSAGNASLAQLDCHPHLTSISERGLAEQVKSVSALECENRVSLPLGGGYTAGIKVLAGEANLRGADASLGGRLGQALSEDAFRDLDRNTSMVNLMTPSDCSENTVKNPRGQEVRVRFCTSALKIESGLNDTVVSMTSMDGGAKAYFVVARMKGFDQANTRMLLEALMDNVRSLR